MSEPVITKTGFQTAGSIVKVSTINAKGGGIVLQVQCPKNGDLAKIATEKTEQGALISFEYKEEQPALPGMDDEA